MLLLDIITIFNIYFPFKKERKEEKIEKEKDGLKQRKAST